MVHTDSSADAGKDADAVWHHLRVFTTDGNKHIGWLQTKVARASVLGWLVSCKELPFIVLYEGAETGRVPPGKAAEPAVAIATQYIVAAGFV